ncbi:hypothetical protein BJP05_10635 [Corynebacterium sp. NML98-0116]|uniref:ATP-binding cassette domain-containing protein n=1 Tax=Corynebacterium TaxID=1716 RepID=UPI000878E47D|nr:MULTISPECIES: ATP-binding cassette domain-containing protein [Corynebacterium]AOX06529.1 hypothetical protein BJP05_10635 [Corynebacterium sp. NML98-0116]MCQ4617370.1 hypothetical protein [Corynebacterium pseudogenitalium]MDK8244058.1 hypothetical protein [Corynebacterium sp. UMB10321]OFT28832.1 hypothetical protein HMPREF3170_08400 [Corynebacterium sp. HMSC08D02]WPJ91919.1 hypothetical protein R0V12_06310 [Corynebacterium sp. UMB2355A]
MDCILRAVDVVVRPGNNPVNLEVGEGFTLVTSPRESGASTLSMALAGRYEPHSGTIELFDEPTTARQRFPEIALAGISLIDSVERSVPTKEIIREQISWELPFFRLIPRDLLGHELVEPWLEPLQFDLDEDKLKLGIGDLSIVDRMRLRVLLALIARPDAPLIIVDDPDQLRNFELRKEFIDNLRDVAKLKPVLVNSVNKEDL